MIEVWFPSCRGLINSSKRDTTVEGSGTLMGFNPSKNQYTSELKLYCLSLLMIFSNILSSVIQLTSCKYCSQREGILPIFSISVLSLDVA